MKAVAWAGPSQGQAVNDGFGLAWDLKKPKSPQLRPGRSRGFQAKPGRHTAGTTDIEEKARSHVCQNGK